MVLRAQIKRLRRRIARERYGVEALRVLGVASRSASELWGQFDLEGLAERARSRSVIITGTAGAGVIVAAVAWWQLVSTHEQSQNRAVGAIVPATRPVVAAIVRVEPPPAVEPDILVTAQRPTHAEPSRAPVGDVDRLKSLYITARQECLSRLAERQDYRLAKARADRLEAEVLELRAAGSPAALRDTSLEWIAAKSVVGTMTAAALKADPQVQTMEMAMRGLGLLPANRQQASDDHADDKPPLNTANAQLSSSQD